MTGLLLQHNPSHTYLLKGIYTVSLRATNTNGQDTEVKSNYITIGVSRVLIS